MSFSSKQKIKDDIDLFDEKIHEKIFERPNKTGIPDDPKNDAESISGISQDDARVRFNSDKPALGSAYTQGTDIHKRLPALQRAEASDTTSHETGVTAEPNKAVVQRVLDTRGLNPKKHGNIIEARDLWNGVFNELLRILPPARQDDFRNAVNAHESARFVNPFMMPEDEDYAIMVRDFADIAADYLNTPPGDVDIMDETLGAGGSVRVMKNTGGHTNTQIRMAIPTVGGGVAFFDTGETREHGKQVSKKKQHREEREKNGAKDALRIKQLNIVNQVARVCRRLLENGMNAAAAILQRFIEDFG